MSRSAHITTDALLIGASIAGAIALARLDVSALLLELPRELLAVSVFAAGVLFVSVFTVAPATVVLGELAAEQALLFVALVGGLGALCGDFIIFKLFRDRIAEDLGRIRLLAPRWRVRRMLPLRITRRVGAVLGALIIASPLPDEIGLAMLGLTRVRTSIFIPLSFLLNAAGILAIGLVARAL